MENPTNTSAPVKPNIFLITVDQLRFPMHFQSLGITSANDFFKQFMPNFHKSIWVNGVKFPNYYTAASDCTAARATIHTGLYAYQTYSMLTLTTYKSKGDQGPPQPQLEDGFPTIGRILKDTAGYNTPYFGKWHLSYDAHNLDKYGYQSFTPPEDFPGFQGQGLEVDVGIADQAAKWVNANWRNQQPFFCSVNFVNPHDKQWFWGGMQGNDYTEVYAQIPVSPPEKPPQKGISGNKPPENQPKRLYDFEINKAITNWQPQSALSKKPTTQTLIKEVFQYEFGGLFEPEQVGPQQYQRVQNPPDFHYAVTPLHPTNPHWHKAIAPWDYWSKALDSYLQLSSSLQVDPLHGMVDDAIGKFMSGIPLEVLNNSIFIFTSDHGEYGSSHGMQGKGGTVYEEGIRVPLVVYDPAGHFATSANVERKQLVSSVDLLRMIVTMGHGGSTSWMQGPYGQLYGNRCDLLKIVQSPTALGRNYALHTTDEFISNALNFNQSPLHVIGLIGMDKDGKKQKLGVYTTWAAYTAGQSQAQVLNNAANPLVTQLEYYDQTNYLNETQPNETISNPTSKEAQVMLDTLFGNPINEILGLLGMELQAPLPTQGYKDAQTTAYQHLIEYMNLVNELSGDPSSADNISEVGRHLIARIGAF